jgi:hypothetical protein
VAREVDRGALSRTFSYWKSRFYPMRPRKAEARVAFSSVHMRCKELSLDILRFQMNAKVV